MSQRALGVTRLHQHSSPLCPRLRGSPRYCEPVFNELFMARRPSLLMQSQFHSLQGARRCGVRMLTLNTHVPLPPSPR